MDFQVEFQRKVIVIDHVLCRDRTNHVGDDRVSSAINSSTRKLTLRHRLHNCLQLLTLLRSTSPIPGCLDLGVLEMIAGTPHLIDSGLGG